MPAERYGAYRMSRTGWVRRGGSGVVVLALLLLAAPAAAGLKPFSGKLAVNDAPIEFEAKKKRGGYRNIPVMHIGNESAGIPAKCGGMWTEFFVDYGNVKVRRDGTINENDNFLFIKGEFKRLDVLKGTIKVDGVGQGVHCKTAGKLEFKAKLES